MLSRGAAFSAVFFARGRRGTLPISIISRPISIICSVRVQHHGREQVGWRRVQTRGIVSELPSITGCIQSALIALQASTGLPWWATFAVSTVFVRVGMFPLVYLQILASRKLGAAIPEQNFLFQLLRERMRGITAGQASERFRILAIYFKGVRACFQLHNVSPLQIISSPLTNMAVFIAFVYSLRGMIVGDNQLNLQEGGFIWFTDMTLRDTTFLLPLTAIGVSYGALELAFKSGGGTVGGAARFTLLIKDTFQSFLLLSMPFVVPLPAGIFAYWIPSSICGILQTLMLRSPRVQHLLRIAPPMPANLNAATAATTATATVTSIAAPVAAVAATTGIAASGSAARVGAAAAREKAQKK